MLCRLCLFESNKEELIPLWDGKDNLPERFNKCVSLKLDEEDELSSMVCKKCIEQLIQWEFFYETCHRSENLLRQRLENGKTEIKEDHLNDTSCEPALSDDDFDSADLIPYLYEAEIEDLCSKAYTYICDICEREFKNCLDYIDHQSVHDGQPVFKCDKCTEVFSYRKELVQHEKKHKTPCPQCGKCVLKTSMKLHLIKHTDRHKCIHCSRCFSSDSELAQHIITIHTNIKNHICETCGKKFSSKTAMKVHLRSHSSERLYHCKHCSYSGKTAAAVYIHMSRHANDVCICKVCSKTFKSDRNLGDHLRRVHTAEKKHRCNFCDRKFVDKYMLTVHVRTHTGARPYPCTLCEKAFVRSDGLKEHMVTHGERLSYKCNKCGKSFASRRSITRHNCTLGI